MRCLFVDVQQINTFSYVIENMAGDYMRFKKIYIEITNSCNLKCSFCIQNQRTPKFMSVQEFEYVLKEIKPYTKYIYLHVLGEPLSHPYLEAILQLCFEYGIQVNMTTNGTLLAKRKEILLNAKALRQINVSLHSFTQHEHISTDTYLKEVFDTCDALAEKGVYISYRLWNMQNHILNDETKNLINKMKVYYPALDMEQEWKRNSITLKERRYLHFEEVFAWPSLQADIVSTQGKCYGMKSMCAILSNGEVVPCCLDSKGDCSFGNIFNQSFSSILESEIVSVFTQNLENKKLTSELCQRCGYRTRFD